MMSSTGRMDVTSHCSPCDITETGANKKHLQSECISSQPTANGTLLHDSTGEKESSTFCLVTWYVWYQMMSSEDWWHHINSVKLSLTSQHIWIHCLPEPEQEAVRWLPVTGWCCIFTLSWDLPATLPPRQQHQHQSDLIRQKSEPWLACLVQVWFSLKISWWGFSKDLSPGPKWHEPHLRPDQSAVTLKSRTTSVC